MKHVEIHCDGSHLPKTNAAYGGYEARVDGQLARCWKGRVEAANSLEAEFQAVIAALKWALKKKHRHVIIYTDCRALEHMVRSGPVPGGKYVQFVRKIVAMTKLIGFVWFQWVPREKNHRADMLCRVARKYA